MDDSLAGGMGDGIGPAGRVQLVQDLADMELRGVDRNSEASGDHLVRSTLSEQRQHLELARRQRRFKINSTGVAVTTAKSAASPASARRNPGTSLSKPATRSARIGSATQIAMTSASAGLSSLKPAVFRRS